MADPINPKPFSAITFDLPANGKQQYETASCAVVYIAKGPGIAPGEISIQFDEFDPFEVAVGDLIRIQRFDKLRIWNNAGVNKNGTVYVSTDPDFLFLNYPRGI